MCIETMEATAKSDFLRKNATTGSNMRYGLVHVSAGEKERAYTPCPGSGFFHRGQKRPQPEEDAPSWGRKGGKRRKENRYHLQQQQQYYQQQHPAGAKAPLNTTQYLMSNAYGDLTAEAIQTHEESREAQLETFLNFLQRDFDEAVADMTW